MCVCKQGAYLRPPSATGSVGAQRTGRINQGQRHKTQDRREMKTVSTDTVHIQTVPQLHLPPGNSLKRNRGHEESEVS